MLSYAKLCCAAAVVTEMEPVSGRWFRGVEEAGCSVPPHCSGSASFPLCVGEHVGVCTGRSGGRVLCSGWLSGLLLARFVSVFVVSLPDIYVPVSVCLWRDLSFGVDVMYPSAQHTQTRKHSHTHAQIHTHRITHTHIHTHTNTHTHTLCDCA